MRNQSVMFYLILAFIVFLLGCDSKYEYTKPSSTLFKNNSIIVNKSREDIWDKIIPKIGKTFFVINNLDKDSGLINISYSGDPEEYVDCGQIHSYIKNLAGQRTYNFPSSRAYQEYEYMEGGYLYHIKRKMDLEGRINIILEEIAPTQTQVTINTKYVLTKTITSQILGSQYYPATQTYTTTFVSGQEGKCTSGIMICKATGGLEREILSLLLDSD